jgi:predicted RNA-binding protein with PUA-like domain
MFFVKVELTDEAIINIGINGDNVFTYCPDCRKEHPVDIYEVFHESVCDEATSVVCDECFQKRRE